MEYLESGIGTGVLILVVIIGLLINVGVRIFSPPKIESKYRACKSTAEGWVATLLQASIVVGMCYFLFSEVVALMVTVAEVVVYFQLMKWGIYGKSLRDSNGEKGASVLDPDVASGMTGWRAFSTLTIIHGFVAVVIVSMEGTYQGWW